MCEASVFESSLQKLNSGGEEEEGEEGASGANGSGRGSGGGRGGGRRGGRGGVEGGGGEVGALTEEDHPEV